MNKNELIDEIIGRLYYKPTSYYHMYLWISEEAYDRIRNLKSWLKRQKLAKLNEIIERLRNG